MERKIHTRMMVLVALILLVAAGYSASVYKMQAQSDAEGLSGDNTYTYYTTVKAARGSILDRNGNVLVTNRASYDLVISNYVLFNSDDPNASLLELGETLQAQGERCVDHLPITDIRRYAYTLDDYSATWQSYFRTYLRERGWDGDMSAENLMQQMRRRYSIPDTWT
ncbi:MAG: hypothetical protein PHS97_04425, partial [Oscillospiraceae bacterium]|nr:hypothetical protein [Oscillospiraceae bacterium]